MTIRNLVRKVKKAGQQAHTAGKLFRRVTNPKNVAKMATNAIRGKGLVLPGSKYIGPGNAMNKGKPTSRADAQAFQHDIDYDNYVKQGKVKPRHVYTGYSDADERLYQGAKKNMHKDPNALAAVLGMGAKKLINKTGLTKRIRDRDVYQNGKPLQANQHQLLANKYNKEKEY